MQQVAVFEKINRPNPNLKIETYIRSGRYEEREKAVFVEVFLLKDYNDSPDELMLLKEAILKIKLIQYN